MDPRTALRRKLAAFDPAEVRLALARSQARLEAEAHVVSLMEELSLGQREVLELLRLAAGGLDQPSTARLLDRARDIVKAMAGPPDTWPPEAFALLDSDVDDPSLGRALGKIQEAFRGMAPPVLPLGSP